MVRMDLLENMGIPIKPPVCSRDDTFFVYSDETHNFGGGHRLSPARADFMRVLVAEYPNRLTTGEIANKAGRDEASQVRKFFRYLKSKQVWQDVVLHDAETETYRLKWPDEGKKAQDYENVRFPTPDDPNVDPQTGQPYPPPLELY
jgi:hypothetical protein